MSIPTIDNWTVRGGAEPVLGGESAAGGAPEPARPGAVVGDRRDRVRVARAPDWRRPGGAPAMIAGSTQVQVSRARHGLAAAGPSSRVVVALALAGLVLLGGAATLVRGMGQIDTATTISTVEVRAGETLGELAARSAPGLPVGDVVRQIRSLNNLPDDAVRAGQALRVPVTAGR